MPQDETPFTFQFRIGAEVRETTDWHDTTRTYRTQALHLTMVRSDGREIHLYGAEAARVIRLLDLRNALSLPALAGGVAASRSETC